MACVITCVLEENIRGDVAGHIYDLEAKRT